MHLRCERGGVALVTGLEVVKHSSKITLHYLSWDAYSEDIIESRSQLHPLFVQSIKVYVYVIHGIGLCKETVGSNLLTGRSGFAEKASL